MSLLLLCLPHIAHAGSYTFTSSSYTCTDSHYTLYQAGQNQYVSYGYTGGTSGLHPIYGLSGTITAVYTWTPNFQGDNPPSSIVVEEDSVVGRIAPTGPLDTGLTGTSGSTVTGGTVVSGSDQVANGGTLALNGQSGNFVQLQQTRVRTLSNPGTTLTFTCTPQATASMPDGYGPVQAGVRYFVTISPPLGLYLKGTTFDTSGNQNILVGQVCTGYVFGIPYGTSATYQWSDPGGTTLTSWTPGSAAVVATWPSSSASPSWYWNDLSGAGRTVQCVVTVGGTPTTLTKTVTEQVPGWTASGTGGYMQVNTACPNQHGANCLYAGPSAGQAGGMNWKATVSTPNTPAAFGTGMLELVQLVTPSMSYVPEPLPSQPHNDPENNLNGLDTGYPYAGLEYAEPSSLLFPAFTPNDSPYLTLDNNIYSGTVQDQFSDWLMYLPPSAGNGIQWVPRATFAWSTNGSATIPGTGNWSDYVKTYGSDSAGTVSPSTTMNFTASNTYPTWTRTNVFPNF